MSGARFNFPRWNYGYTLGPPTAANGGNYTQFYMQQPQQPSFGGLIGPRVPRPPFRGSNRGNRGGATVKSTETPTAAATAAKPTPASSAGDDQAKEKPEAATESSEKKPDNDQETNKTSTTTTEAGVKEDGEIIERPLNEILRGRNPIMFCNDQSKLRNLHMEWEQVSETGPPHDKTFTWSLKMGEMMTMGSANSKKGAKNKAAEEMVKKLDQLPKVNIKRHFHQAFGPPFMMRGAMRGRGRGGGFFGAMPPPPPPPHFFAGGSAGGGGGSPHFPKKPKKTEAEESAAPAKSDSAATDASKAEEAAKPLHPAQNNPISKLYEHTKKRKLPEPVFEVVQEEVLETRKTTQGFTYKKTKFTIQCDILGKKYLGESMNKKTAKFNAAAAAWAEIGAGVGQASIDSLLQSGRQAAEAAASAATAVSSS